MSYPSTAQADINENLLDGRYLSKSQLIERLVKMNVDLDHSKVEHKQHFVDLYNRVIQQTDFRMKIKPILDTDIIDRPQKVLKKKRERDLSGEGEIIPSRVYAIEEAENINRFRIEINNQIEEREKNCVEAEQEDSEINNQTKFYSKNLDLDNFMTKIHSDLNSYKNRIRNNFEAALFEIKKAQSNKEQPRVNLQQIKIDFPQGEARIQSKNNSQRNSRTNLKAVEKSSKNIPAMTEDQILEMSGDNRLEINLNKNHKEELENSFADSSASDSQNNPDPTTIKQPLPRRRNATIIEPTGSFPKIESINTRRSLPGSSKNIQEILNKIDFKSNQPQSPTNLNDQNRSAAFKSFRRESQYSVLSQRRSSLNRMNSARQVLINIRETPSNVTEFSTANDVDSNIIKYSSEISLSIFPIEAKIFDFKNFRYFIYYSLLMSGFILISYFILKNTNFSQIENKHIYLVCFIALALFSFILFKKLNSKKFFRKTANEDYETIKTIIQNLYQIEENPIGLFENNIIRDFSSKHQMSEETYKKFIFPLLKKLRDEEKTMIEGEVIIQEQAQNIWKLK